MTMMIKKMKNSNEGYFSKEELEKYKASVSKLFKPTGLNIYDLCGENKMENKTISKEQSKKVINALKQCSNSDGRSCKTCPYSSANPNSYDVDCFMYLAHDAIELIEQLMNR